MSNTRELPEASTKELRMGDLDFLIDGIRFKVLIDEYSSRVTDQDGVVILKSEQFARAELKALRGLEVCRMLELGIWQGGSAILWPILLPTLTRYVGVDISQRDIEWPVEVLQHPRWRTVTLHHGVSQGDATALRDIIAEDFDGPLELVLDDASHRYELSRTAFETCFPHLRPGGAYIIEDWAWAHWPGPWQEPDHHLAHQPALSNLVLELVILAASRRDVIESLSVNRDFVVVFRGDAFLDENFDIEALSLSRGRHLDHI